MTPNQINDLRSKVSKSGTHGMTFIEELRIRGCEKVRNGPDLFASNYELALVA